MFTFLEYDIAKRRLSFGNQILVNGKGYYESKSKEDIIKEEDSWNRYSLNTNKQKLYLESIIVTLIFILVVIEFVYYKRKKRNF